MNIIRKLPGITVYAAKWMHGGICLPGIGIFINPDHYPSWFLPYVLLHEYGHYLDYEHSEDLRPFPMLQFYLRIGFPSLLNALTGLGGEHRTFWTEIRANKCAKAFFEHELPRDYQKYFPYE